MRELIFLTIANNLPRLRICDGFRWRLYKLAGLKIKQPCSIWGPLTIRPIGGAKNIIIGANSFLNTEIRFGVPSSNVIIGQNVQIGPRVCFETVNHDFAHKFDKKRDAKTAPIIIEDNTWIGANATILSGVTVHSGAVVAAGSVVTKDVPSKTLVGGVPAKVIRELIDLE